MSIKQNVSDIINNNDTIQAAQAIANMLSATTTTEKELVSILYFTMFHSELKGKESVAKLFANKAEQILNNLDMLNELISE